MTQCVGWSNVEILVGIFGLNDIKYLTRRLSFKMQPRNSAQRSVGSAVLAVVARNLAQSGLWTEMDIGHHMHSFPLWDFLCGLRKNLRQMLRRRRTPTRPAPLVRWDKLNNSSSPAGTLGSWETRERKSSARGIAFLPYEGDRSLWGASLKIECLVINVPETNTVYQLNH